MNECQCKDHKPVPVVEDKVVLQKFEADLPEQTLNIETVRVFTGPTGESILLTDEQLLELARGEEEQYAKNGARIFWTALIIFGGALAFVILERLYHLWIR